MSDGRILGPSGSGVGLPGASTAFGTPPPNNSFYTYLTLPAAASSPVGAFVYTTDQGFVYSNGVTWLPFGGGTPVVNSDGTITVAGSNISASPLNIVPGTYTYASLPAPASATNKYAVTTDFGPVFSNGSNWEILFNPTQGVLAISVNSPLTQAQQSTAYSQALTATGGVGTLTWSLISKFGATNNWIISGTNLTGTPATITTDTLGLQVSDQTGAFAQKVVTVQTVAALTPAATPTFSPVGGAYTFTQTVTISDSTPSSTIYYTTNGSTPTTGSTVYTTPITVSVTTTIKAIATAPGFTQSAVGSALYTISAAAFNPIGVNFPAGGGNNVYYEGFPIFRNRVREGNSFMSGGVPVAVDANGWPTSTFQVELFNSSGSQSWSTGGFSCGFTLSVGFTLTANNATISSQTTVGNNTTFTLTSTGNNFGFTVTYTGTHSCTNIFAFLPSYNTQSSIDDVTQSSAYTTDAVNFYKQFDHIRWMEPANAVSNQLLCTSTNRYTNLNWQAPDGQPKGQGLFPWEAVAAFHKAMGNAPWINIPGIVDSTNTYAQSLATMLFNTISAGQKIWIEFADELWNNLFSSGLQSYTFKNVATSTIDPNTGSAFPNSSTYLAYLIHQLAGIFRTTYGGTRFTNDIRLVLAWQAGGNGISGYSGMFTYYSTNGWSVPSDIYCISVAPYLNPVIDNGNSSTIAQIINDITSATPNNARAYKMENIAIMGLKYGLPMVPYEGGAQWNNAQYASVTNLGAAILDPTYVAAIEGYYTDVLNHGTYSFTQFKGGVAATGGVTAPADELATVYATLVSTGSSPLAALQSFMSGFTPTFNVVGGSGAVIDGTHYADNLNDSSAPNGAVTFASGPASGSTSGTLAASWSGAGGLWRVTFSDGTTRVCQFIHNSTLCSWNLSAFNPTTALPNTVTTAATIVAGVASLNLGGFTYAPYYGPNGYVPYLINCTKAGTYSLVVTMANVSGTPTTNVEIGGVGVPGVVVYSALTLVNGTNTLGNVTLTLGINYVLLGKNGSQGTTAQNTISQLQFN